MAVWPSCHVTGLSSGLFRPKLNSSFECTVVITSFGAVDVDAECEASSMCSVNQTLILLTVTRCLIWTKINGELGLYDRLR